MRINGGLRLRLHLAYLLSVRVNRPGRLLTLQPMNTKALQKKFGRRVRSLRKQRDLTQEQLSEAAHVSPEYISKIERGKASPSFDSISNLASALRVAPGDLFDFSELE